MLDEPQDAARVIRRIRTRYPEVTLLATCRRGQNGGQFGGSIEQEFELLHAATEAGAQAVDIEIESAEEAPERTAAFRDRVKVVVSYHNFHSTPVLGPVLRRLDKAPADVLKLVTMATKPSDNWRVLDLARHHQGKPLVALAMGEIGAPSRVLSLSRHCAFTYAAPPCRAATEGKEEGTAPGQISSSVLRRQYRVDRHTCSTAVYGVIANPVGHSLSPAVHNRAFQARRIDAVYLPFLVEERQLSDFFQLAARLPVAGFSVTIPHKQRVLRHLDAVDPLARRIGAVNTVYRKQGKLRGTNTDAAGITVPLEKRIKLKGAQILIAGNGGAARGAAFALGEKGARIFLTGRNPARVRALARACGAESIGREQASSRRFDALVHATPAGMHPKPDECFFEDAIPAGLVFEMVYNPLETLLLKKARAAGKIVISGLEMFLEQAALQFEIWTGAGAPRMAMETVAREALK
jgi:3-dehydroquinate dehydratase/shikimate dehydrogenase